MCSMAVCSVSSSADWSVTPVSARVAFDWLLPMSGSSTGAVGRLLGERKDVGGTEGFVLKCLDQC